MQVECSACGKWILIRQDIDYDTQLLTRHANVHLQQDANFRKQFNDSPITFPIQYTEVDEDYNNG